MVSQYMYVTNCKVNYSQDKIMQAKCYCHSMQTFLPFHIGRKQIWPANNCLQIMVCSCLMIPNCVWLQKIFCPCINETMRDRSCLKKGRLLHFPKIFIKKQTWWSNDKTIIDLRYRKILWFASASHINYLPQPSASANNWSARPDKSQYFAQPRPLIVNYPTGLTVMNYLPDRFFNFS